MTNLPNIKTKNGVVINGAHFLPEIAKIVQVARETAPQLTDDTVWITSANDSKHMVGSLHYENKAFDIRTRNIINKEKFAPKWTEAMQRELGGDYDVVWERTHLHVEYDPET